MFKFLVFSCFIALALAVKEYDDKLVASHASIEQSGRHLCSGAIIGRNVILTAASCLNDLDESTLKVRVGTRQLESSGSLHQVKRLIPHKRYQTNRKDFDLALVMLEDDLRLSEMVQMAHLPRGNDVTPPRDGTTVRLTSFGLENKSELSNSLLSEELMISMPMHCKNAYAPKIIYITERMLCAELKTKHECLEDPGSPLMMDDVLVGILAFEQKCGSSQFPGIYTNVASLRKWISEQVDI